MRNNQFSPHRPRRLLSALFLSGSIFALAGWSRAAEDAGSVWLDRLARMDELNFRGVLAYTRGDHQESLRVTHGVYNGETYERLEHLDGDNREVLRHGEQLTCIQLGQRLNRLLHRHLLKAGLENLQPYYAISVGEESRIAGRRAVAMNIKPRDDFRFGYRLALDRDTGLLLRMETVNSLGRVLERLQFVDVQIGGPLKKEWLGDAIALPPPETANTLPIERVIEEEQMQWKPRWLPPGFSLALAPRHADDAALTYSDGLAVLSVFVETANAPIPSGEGSAAQGATVAYTRPLEMSGAPRVVVVVGEVPAATAKRIADSVAWGDTPAAAGIR